MTTILPTDRAIRYFVSGLDEPITGVTQVGNLTGVNPALDVVSDEDDNEFLHAVPVDALVAEPSKVNSVPVGLGPTTHHLPSISDMPVLPSAK